MEAFESQMGRHLFIGLGGSGAQALLTARMAFLNEWNTPSPPHVAFFHLDLDSAPARLSPSGDGLLAQSLAFGRQESLHISLNPQTITPEGLRQNPHIRDWWALEGRGPSFLQQTTREGAGQLRPLARLALFCQWNGVSDALQKALDTLKSRRCGAAENADGGGVSVHVVAGLGGGTGSGLLLDLLGLLAALDPQLHISLWLLSSSLTAGLDSGIAQLENHMATLVECDAALQGTSESSPLSVRYSPGGSREARPLNVSHMWLVGKDLEGHATQSAAGGTGSVGMALAAFAMAPPFWAALRSGWINAAQEKARPHTHPLELDGYDTPLTYQRIYGAMGFASLVSPIPRLRNFAKWAVLTGALESLTLGKNEEAREDSEALLLLQQLGLHQTVAEPHLNNELGAFPGGEGAHPKIESHLQAHIQRHQVHIEQKWTREEFRSSHHALLKEWETLLGRSHGESSEWRNILLKNAARRLEDFRKNAVQSVLNWAEARGHSLRDIECLLENAREILLRRHTLLAVPGLQRAIAEQRAHEALAEKEWGLCRMDLQSLMERKGLMRPSRSLKRWALERWGQSALAYAVQRSRRALYLVALQHTLDCMDVLSDVQHRLGVSVRRLSHWAQSTRAMVRRYAQAPQMGETRTGAWVCEVGGPSGEERLVEILMGGHPGGLRGLSAESLLCQRESHARWSRLNALVEALPDWESDFQETLQSAVQEVLRGSHALQSALHTHSVTSAFLKLSDEERKSLLGRLLAESRPMWKRSHLWTPSREVPLRLTVAVPDVPGDSTRLIADLLNSQADGVREWEPPVRVEGLDSIFVFQQRQALPACAFEDNVRCHRAWKAMLARSQGGQKAQWNGVDEALSRHTLPMGPFLPGLIPPTHSEALMQLEIRVLLFKGVLAGVLKPQWRIGMADVLGPCWEALEFVRLEGKAHEVLRTVREGNWAQLLYRVYGTPLEAHIQSAWARLLKKIRGDLGWGAIDPQSATPLLALLTYWQMCFFPKTTEESHDLVPARPLEHAALERIRCDVGGDSGEGVGMGLALETLLGWAAVVRGHGGNPVAPLAHTAVIAQQSWWPAFQRNWSLLCGGVPGHMRLPLLVWDGGSAEADPFTPQLQGGQMPPVDERTGGEAQDQP